MDGLLKKIIISGVLAGVLAVTVGCGSSPSQGLTARSARAATEKACSDLNTWEGTGAPGTAQVQKQIDAVAGGTAFARDFAAWASGTAGNTKLIADCHAYYSNVLSFGQAAQPTLTPTPTPATTPTCDASTWETNNIGGEPSSVAADLSNIQSDISNVDQLSLSSDGHQLYTDALAALHHDMPPRCARALYHDAKTMLLSFAIAGAALYLAGLNPARTTALNNQAAKDLSTASRYHRKVERTCGGC